MINLLRKYPTFLIASVGCVLDIFSTIVGLNRGFYETHSQYTFLNAFLFWMGICLVMEGLKYSLTRKNIWFNRLTMAVASASWLGFVNNTLVILGIFGGLII